MTSSEQHWQIGEIAKQTGISDRTLRHYDEIGLLTPSARSDAGYRLYTKDDLARLQQIVALKNLNLSLEQIADMLKNPRTSAITLMESQMNTVRSQLAQTQELLSRLDRIIRFLKSQNAGTGEEMLQAISLLNQIEKAYTPEEMDFLRQRAETLGEERIKAVEQEWPQLIATVKDCMERGVDPSNEELKPLMRRWQELGEAFTGGNPQIAAKVKKMYEEGGAMQQSPFGPDPELMKYVQRAMEQL